MKTGIEKKLTAVLIVFLLSFPVLYLFAEEATPFCPHYIIAIDNSGSMNENDASQRTRKFTLSFFRRLKVNDKVTVITFGATGKVVITRHIGSIDDAEILQSRVARLPFNESYTDIKDGFDFVLDYKDSKKIKDEQALVLFLTDGKLSLASSMQLSFPEKFLNNDDYAGLLSEFSPYIFGNSIERGMVKAFNEGINELGERLIYRDIIPRLKEEITPLFILSFSEETLMLKKIAGSIALKSGIENYFHIGNINDEENFINSFFKYVADLMVLREKKRLGELKALKALQEAGKLQKENHVNEDAGAILHVAEEKTSERPKEDTVEGIGLFLKQEDVFKSDKKEDSLIKVEGNMDKKIGTVLPVPEELVFKVVPPKQEAGRNKGFLLVLILIVVAIFLTLIALIIRLLKRRKSFEVVKTSAVPENISEQRKELLPLDSEVLKKMSRLLDEFRRKALEESDEYLSAFIKSLGGKIGLKISTELDYDEKRLDFCHEINPDIPIKFVFSSDGFKMDGNLTNISENGCEIIDGTINTGELPTTGLKGELEMKYKGRSCTIKPVTIVYIDKENNCCGLSMNELEYNLDMKLLWYETYTGIISDIKEK